MLRRLKGLTALVLAAALFLATVAEAFACPPIPGYGLVYGYVVGETCEATPDSTVC